MTRSAIHTDRGHGEEGLREKLRLLTTGVAAILAMIALRGALAAAPVLPPGPPVPIDLPPGSLQQALATLANRTGLQILYDPNVIEGVTVKGFHGVMTPGEALRRLLSSTHISFEFTAADAVALHGDDTPETRSAPFLAVPHTVTISANRDRGFVAGSSASLTSVKIDESSLLMPVASSSLRLTGGFFPGANHEGRRIYNLDAHDNTRRDMLVLLLRTLIDRKVPGAFAELGVYK
jgi:hypothetical protein